MLLLLQFGLHVLADARAVFNQLCGMLLPGDSFLILLMQTDRTEAVAGFRAGDRKDGALSTWHSGGILRIFASGASEICLLRLIRR